MIPGFRSLLPDVIGAIDGTHIAIEAPEHMKSAYINYNLFLSI